MADDILGTLRITVGRRLFRLIRTKFTFVASFAPVFAYTQVVLAEKQEVSVAKRKLYENLSFERFELEACCPAP